ncbi:MAG: hypothetical protein HY779_03215, partial [Rubrobacteridae bacterium]|nr:hypothetical protein [Rubrobacteridae bacterium]
EPDIVIVWNEFQKAEAVEIHGISPIKIVTTGAQHLDDWFKREPGTTREEYSNKVGINPEKPFLLYVCSSVFIARNEVAFVKRWIEAIRASSDSNLNMAGIVIRPHPVNYQQWEDVDMSYFGNAVVWPSKGAIPIDEQSKTDYYDSIFHSSGIVGINTSALIEAGVIGRPVFTILASDFEDTQEGTLHFHHLVNGGLLNVCKNLEEHVSQLSIALADNIDNKSAKRFVQEFLRPNGIDKDCVPFIADAVEKLGKQKADYQKSTTMSEYILRLALFPLAILSRKNHGKRRLKNRTSAK